MKRSLIFTILFVLSATPAVAIVITSGTAHSTKPLSGGVLSGSLVGDGFAAQAGGLNEGFPGGRFGVGIFFPGDPMSVFDQSCCSELRGTVQFGDTLFRAGCLDIPIGCNASLTWRFQTATLETPQFDGPSLLHVLFTFDGSFSAFDRVGFVANEGLAGHGVADLHLRLEPICAPQGACWRISDVDYTFFTPEPSTLMLVAGGLVALAARWGRRLTSARPRI